MAETVLPDKTLRKSHLLISETVAALTTYPTITQAAEIGLGITRQSLYERLQNYPEIREAVDRIKTNASMILASASERAAETIVGGLDDKKNKYLMAQDILDRVGVKKESKTPGIAIQFNFNSKKYVKER